MIRSLIFATLIALPIPTFAGVKDAVQDHALPRAHSFAVQARALAVNAGVDCTAEAVIPSYHNVFDAWMGLSHLAFGPIETDGRGLAISFWPDKRGMVGSSVARLIAEQDQAVDDGGEFAQVSIAGRGLFALERLLFDPAYAGYDRADYSCRLVQAIARDLDRMAREIDTGWQAEAEALLNTGTPGNTRYLSDKEAAQRLYTALLAGLEFDADQRLGRPLGSFDRPRPERAEARRSERSLRNVIVSLKATRDLALKLATQPIPVSEAAFDSALAEAEALDSPVFGGVSDPSGRLKVEILQQRIRAARTAVAGEIGAQLGVSSGFNSADGD